MKIFYYYHISKTGGTFVHSLFKHLNKKFDKSILYSYHLKKIEDDQKDINFDLILSDKNLKKYNYIFIYHHHGFNGLMHYKNFLIKKKNELESKGHKLIIFSTFRDVLSFNNSRFNFLKDKYLSELTKEDFLAKEIHFNIQIKYFNFCHHGEWPKGKITLDKINKQISKSNIADIIRVVDIFIETNQLSKFFSNIAKSFDLKFDTEKKINSNKHSVKFDDCKTELIKKNKLDQLLFQELKSNKKRNFEKMKINFNDLLQL